MNCVEKLGWNVTRSTSVFASWNGINTLTLGDRNDLDPDDHIGQMILHELCHSLIEGPSSWTLVDWGLDNMSDVHLVNELACHRLQSALSDQVLLRSFFAVTTDWRPYFDAIPLDWTSPQTTSQVETWSIEFRKSIVEAQRLDKEAIRLAHKGLSLLYSESNKHMAIVEALEHTKTLVHMLGSIAPRHSLWSM